MSSIPSSSSSFIYEGIPCNPTVGNMNENISECIRKQLQLPQIYLVHRLDSDTTGLLVLGKTLKFAQTFQKYFANKIYLALLIQRGDSQPFFTLPSTGTTLTHYMETSKTPPKFLHEVNDLNRKICQCVVRKVSPPLTLSTHQWRHKSNIFKSSHPHLSRAICEWVDPYSTIFDYYRATKEEKYLVRVYFQSRVTQPSGSSLRIHFS